jgi:nucleotide-binding universal stress UspA family protein
MFKHILLPTDGTPLSESAVRKGIALAHDHGARVTGVHVSPQFHLLTYRTDMLEETRDEYERDSRAHAERYLKFISDTAREQGVACQTLRETSDDVSATLLEVARSRGCDLIAMASHGRRGLSGLLLGSETQRVLMHSGVPVLVWR